MGKGEKASPGRVMKAKTLTKTLKTLGAASHLKKKVVEAEESDKEPKYLMGKNERGYGMKFPLEMYQKIAACKPGTKVKYVPNPKTKGSKSFDRYAKYEKAKTVGEALKMGSKVADLLWELQRGYLTITGGERTEAGEIAAIGKEEYDKAVHNLTKFNGPRGIAFSIHDERAAEQLEKEEAWRKQRLARVEALAKTLGLKPEKPTDLQNGDIHEDLDLRLQRRVANALAEKYLKEATSAKRKLSYENVEECLKCWGFGQNIGRINVMQKGQKYVYSDTLGVIRRRTGGVGATPPTLRYPCFSQLLCRWLSENLPQAVKGKFVCSAINLNANYAGKRHRDQNNEGPSIIRAFGNFKGGSLRYWPGDTKKAGLSKKNLDTLCLKDSKAYNLKKTTVVFDGNRAHEVEPFEGERYSVVFFTAGGYKKVDKKLEATMKRLGYPWPTSAAVQKLKQVAYKDTE
mmetsp:Transcript_17757/g.41177  ORF Transcript_17757/g.41177 Transcript_17757/m.41177 type:complete len:458 (+) Transcript_17757:55-1428(+)